MITQAALIGAIHFKPAVVARDNESLYSPQMVQLRNNKNNNN